MKIPNFWLIFAVGVFSFTGTISNAHAQEFSGKGSESNQISCESTIFKCLSQEEMQTLVGKTLKYRHGRFQDFGLVSFVMKPGGKFEGKNNKGPANGAWEAKGANSVSFKTDRWDNFSFFFVRIGQQLFICANHDTGGSSFAPVEVTNSNE